MSQAAYRLLKVFALCFAFSYLLFLVLESRYLFGTFVYLDDTIYISKAFFGQADVLNTVPIPHLIISFLSGAQSVALIKLVWLAFYAASAGFIAAIFALYIEGLMLPALIGLAIGTLPISSDQIIFITGSHSTLAMFFILAALLLFSRNCHYRGARFIYSSLGVSLLLLCAAFSSATGILAPVVFPIWLLVHWVSSAPAERRSVDVLLAFGVCGLAASVAFAFSPLGGYHYSNMEGWLDFSASRVFENLLFAIRHSVSFVVKASPIVNMLYVLCVGMLIVLVATRAVFNSKISAERRKTKSTQFAGLAVLGANAIFVAALAFGPSSILTAMLDRYLLVPVVFGAICVMALVLMTLQSINRWQRICFLLFLAFVTALNIVRTEQIHDLRLARYFKVHESIVELVRHEQEKWPKDAQVLILISGKKASPTESVNHWSTWYLRMLTGNSNLIGIVGNPDEITRSPFMGAYSDHGNKYWRVVNGRLRRYRMVGLEQERPLFAYQLSKSGQFEALDFVAFTDGDTIRYVGRGRSYLDAGEYTDLLDICSEASKPRMFTWPGEMSRSFVADIDSDPLATRMNKNRSFSGSESKKFKLEVPAGSPVRISFDISSSRSIDSPRYDDFSPPMPVLTDNFAIYQQPDGFIFADRNGPGSWKLKTGDHGAEVRLEGIEDCAIFARSGHQILGNLVTRSVSGKWMLGRGYNQRYWAGTITRRTIEN